MIGAAIAIVAAWLIGFFSAGVDASTFVSKVLPGAVSIDRSGEYYVGRDAAGAIIATHRRVAGRCRQDLSDTV